MIKTKWGSELKFYDDYPFDDGKLFVYGHEFGPIGVIRAKSWEDALEIAYDEFLTPIPQDEVPEAYGCANQAELDAKVAGAGDSGIDLVEGYYYQANATGSGIVNPGDYEWLDSLTLAKAAELELSEFDIPNIDAEWEN